MRRTVFALLTVLALAAGRAEALTIRDVIELSKAGLSETVLLALIEVDRRVFAIDTATLKQLKEAGVTDAVIVALIRSGRTQPPPQPEPAPAPVPDTRPEPEVIVIERQAPAPAPAPIAIPYPVAVPVYVTAPSRRLSRHDTVTTTIPTDIGLVKARLPIPANCVKAEPVYWGFGGKLRPGSWEPPPTVVCR
jgi:outer membrane biosynthesis protein TonB